MSKRLTSWLESHVRQYRRLYECMHLGYFLAVFAGGPYKWLAGSLFLAGLVAVLWVPEHD